VLHDAEAAAQVAPIADMVAGIGTVLRSSTVHALAGTAGYRSSHELPVDNDFRFYRLDR
jgi:hypothetical protein